VQRQLTARTWSKPLAAAATRPRHFFFMDRRWFWLCVFGGVVTTFATDIRWQGIFLVTTLLAIAAGVALWRHNPYLIDELQAEFALPHGGPSDAYEDV
jgi:hypothetical protein